MSRSCQTNAVSVWIRSPLWNPDCILRSLDRVARWLVVSSNTCSGNFGPTFQVKVVLSGRKPCLSHCWLTTIATGATLPLQDGSEKPTRMTADEVVLPWIGSYDYAACLGNPAILAANVAQLVLQLKGVCHSGCWDPKPLAKVVKTSTRSLWVPNSFIKMEVNFETLDFIVSQLD